MTKTIISCAITGAVHTPSMSPHLPCAPEEIGEIMAILSDTLEALAGEFGLPVNR